MKERYAGPMVRRNLHSFLKSSVMDFVVETTDSPSLPVMGIDGSRGFSSSSVFSLGEEVSSTKGGFSCGLVMEGGISGRELMVVGVYV